MNVQVIMRDGSPEYAVLPWDEYQALLAAVGAPSSSATVSSPDTQRRSVGISPAYLALIEAGERVPDAAIRRALARALEIDGWEGDA